MSVPSFQFLHLTSFIAILSSNSFVFSFQLLNFSSSISFPSLQFFFISIYSFWFIRFNSFMSGHVRSLNSVNSFQLIYSNFFISILSFHSWQFIRFNLCVSIPEFQVIHVNWFTSINSFHACHFISIHFLPTHHEFLEATSLFRNFRPGTCRTLPGSSSKTKDESPRVYYQERCHNTSPTRSPHKQQVPLQHSCQVSKRNHFWNTHTKDVVRHLDVTSTRATRFHFTQNQRSRFIFEILKCAICQGPQVPVQPKAGTLMNLGRPGSSVQSCARRTLAPWIISKWMNMI